MFKKEYGFFYAETFKIYAETGLMDIFNGFTLRFTLWTLTLRHIHCGKELTKIYLYKWLSDRNGKSFRLKGFY